MKRSDIPNLITGLRILLVVPTVACLLAHEFRAALALIAVAGASDGIDGYLARRYDWISRLGGLLDAAADKLLMLACFLSLGWLGLLPAWLITTVIARDIVIVGGAAAFRLLIGPFDPEPSRISKFNTVVQILLILVAILAQGIWAPAVVWQPVLVWTVFASALLSGLGYVWTWSRRALQRGRS